MKISIITVCYNSESTIDLTMQSVLAQKDINLEYILVDGKSSDNTVGIIDSYAQKYPDVIRYISEKDNGIYDAMNKGIALATGDIVGILNSDDCYCTDDVLVSVCNTLQNKDLDCCYGNLLYLKGNKPYRYWHSGMPKSFKLGWMPPHPSLFVRRSVYDKCGVFRLDCGTSADYELMLRFFYKNKVKSQWIDKDFVYMQLGGASNANFGSYVKAGKTDKKAWVVNDCKIPLLIAITKRIQKIPQFIMARRYVSYYPGFTLSIADKSRKSKLTVSLVLYNTPKDQIDGCVGSVLRSGCVDTLYIVDNSPVETMGEFFKGMKGVVYIPHDNTGYGSSHNLAIKKAIEDGSTYHIVLNPDVLFTPETLKSLVTFMDNNPDAASVMPRVIYPDGELQYLCKQLPDPVFMFNRRFFKKIPFVSRLNNYYELHHSGYDHVFNPPCLSGCFMFLRTSTLRDNNIFFDDRFFMYFEDFDLVRRLHRVGKTLYYPEVTVIHNHERASYHSWPMLKVHLKSAVMYFNKYGWFIDRERRLFNQKVLKEIKEYNKNRDK